MNIIDWVLYIPLTLCVCYLLLYAIASKFYRAPQYPEAGTLPCYSPPTRKTV